MIEWNALAGLGERCSEDLPRRRERPARRFRGAAQFHWSFLTRAGVIVRRGTGAKGLDCDIFPPVPV